MKRRLKTAITRTSRSEVQVSAQTCSECSGQHKVFICGKLKNNGSYGAGTFCTDGIVRLRDISQATAHQCQNAESVTKAIKHSYIMEGKESTSKDKQQTGDSFGNEVHSVLLCKAIVPVMERDVSM